MFLFEKYKNVKSKILKSEFWKKLFKNSFYAVLGEGGASVVNLLSVIVLIKVLGSTKYGILTLAQSYMLIVDTIINMQSWNAVIKYGEISKKNNDIEEYSGYIKLGTILDVSTAIIGCIVGILIPVFLGNYISWDKEMIMCSIIFSIEILFHFSGTPTAILRMENKFHLISIQKIVSAIFKVISLFIVYLIQQKISLLVGVIIFVSTDILGHVLLTLMALFVINKKIGLRKIIKSTIPNSSKQFISFTFWNTLTDISDIPVQNLDVFLVSNLGIDKVAIYKVFKQILAMFSKLTKPIYQAIYPQFSALVANNKKKEGYDVVLKIKRVILKYFLPLSIFFGISSYFWLDRFFEIGYSQYWYILTLYVFVHTIALSYTTIHPYFISLGNAYLACIYSLISNILYLLLTFILIKYIGFIGMVIGYFVQFYTLIYLKKRRIKKELKN